MVEDVERREVGGANRAIADERARGGRDRAAGAPPGKEAGARHKIVMGVDTGGTFGCRPPFMEEHEND